MNFKDFAILGRSDPCARIDVDKHESGTGWVLSGPEGPFTEKGEIKIFSEAELRDIHAQLREWGFTRFYENGQLKQFPEDNCDDTDLDEVT